jgi:hypothetical protein
VHEVTECLKTEQFYTSARLLLRSGFQLYVRDLTRFHSVMNAMASHWLLHPSPSSGVRSSSNCSNNSLQLPVSKISLSHSHLSNSRKAWDMIVPCNPGRVQLLLYSPPLILDQQCHSKRCAMQNMFMTISDLCFEPSVDSRTLHLSCWASADFS